VKTVQRRLARRTYTQLSDRSAQFSLKFETQSVEQSIVRLARSHLSPIFKFTTPVPSDVMVSVYGEAALIAGIVEHGVTDPAKRVAFFLARMCGDYLGALDTVDIGNDEAGRKTVDDYLRFVEQDEVQHVEQIVIGGISPPTQPIEVLDGAVRLRALTEIELGELSSPLSDAIVSLMEDRQTFPSPDVGCESCMLTTRTVLSKHAPDEAQHRVTRIMLALELLGYTISAPGGGTFWREPGPRLSESIASKVRFARRPIRGEADVTSLTLSHAAALADRIPINWLEEARTREAVLLDRFALATSQEKDAEAIIDYVIALEGLLVPESQTEVKHRFSVNGARYLVDAERRRDAYDLLKHLYDTRSKLVHGGVVKGDLKSERDSARHFACLGLSKALFNGWPTAEDFLSNTLTAD
jgi:hypothetical protein